MNHNPDAARDIQMQVVARDKHVALLFSRLQDGQLVAAKTDCVQIPTENAVAFAQVVTDLAFEVDSGLKPVGPTLKAELAERHRQAIMGKLVAVFNTYREDANKSHADLAKTCAEVAINEIFS